MAFQSAVFYTFHRATQVVTFFGMCEWHVCVAPFDGLEERAVDDKNQFDIQMKKSNVVPIWRDGIKLLKGLFNGIAYYST